MTRTPRRVRVWALVDPRGRVREIRFTAAEVRGLIHRYFISTQAYETWALDLRRARRAGWRVRRLAPEEVEP